MDDDRGGQTERMPLPGYYHEPAVRRRPAYGWYPEDYPPPQAHWGGGYPRYGGVRGARRTSTWTAAALIAGVAATTGYLAHSIPATGASNTGTTVGKAKHHRQTSRSTGYQQSQPSAPAPVVQPPVVTSGGSGAAGGGGDR